MRVFIDRDGVALPDGARPQARGCDLREAEDLCTILVRVGIPLHFVDGSGVWIVSIGSGERGSAPIAVVRQVPDGAGSKAEVPFAVTTPVADLLSDDGNLRLYFSSAPGPATDVVDAAKQGKFQIEPPRGLVDNFALRGAVASFASKPEQKSMLDVLRQSLGGLALLDITGSEPGTMTIWSGSGPDGKPALFAFTNQEQVEKFHRQRNDNRPTQTLVVPADSLPQMVLDKPDSNWLYIDPAGPTCALTRQDLQFATQGKPNTSVKNALGGNPTQQDLFTALCSGNRVYLAETIAPNGQASVLTLPDSYGVERLAVFTSPAEIAAWDSALKIRDAAVGGVLTHVFRSRIAGIVLNPGGPFAVIDSFQIWHILANPSLKPEDVGLPDALQRALQGDTTVLPDISRADHDSLRRAEAEIGSPLIVTRTAAVKVLRGLIEDRFPPTTAQIWASFMMYGYVAGGRGPITPLDIDYEEEWEDAIATAISRLEEIGDLIDGEVTKDEALKLIQDLGEPKG